MHRGGDCDAFHSFLSRKLHRLKSLHEFVDAVSVTVTLHWTMGGWCQQHWLWLTSCDESEFKESGGPRLRPLEITIDWIHVHSNTFTHQWSETHQFVWGTLEQNYTDESAVTSHQRSKVTPTEGLTQQLSEYYLFTVLMSWCSLLTFSSLANLRSPDGHALNNRIRLKQIQLLLWTELRNLNC